MENTVFINISLVLGIAIGVAFLIQLLRQPLIISYIITGIICGPLFLNLINSSQAFFDLFAKFGVVLLLFLVGLGLNINYLKKIGKVAAFTGIGQVIFTSLFGFLILSAIGFASMPALYLAVSITFSSTIIIMKLLSDKRELGTVHGRYTVGLMLVQDMIAILIMILLPILQTEQAILSSLLILLAKGVTVLAVVYFLSKFFLPMALNRVAQSGEFLLVFTLAWCFAIAGFGEWAGLSLEVGAIIAGLSLGSSIYQTEISSRIKPIRDFFIVIFFIILGSQMNMENMAAIIKPGVILSAFVLIGNPLILYFLFRKMKFTRRNSFLAGLTAAQVSEFGFVLLFVAQEKGYVDSDILSIFTLVALITIFVSSYLITYNHHVYRIFNPFFKLFGKDKYTSIVGPVEKFEVIVFGYHRLGWKICETLSTMGVSYAVVDYDPSAITRLKENGIPCFFGDATDVEFLSELPLDKAKLVISTLPDEEGQMTLIEYIRKDNSKTIVIGNLSQTKFLDNVYESGADYVVVPHLVSGQWLSKILKKKSWTKRTFKELHKDQEKEMQARVVLGLH